MPYIAITGSSVVTVTGTNYSADVPITAYDDENTVIGSTTISITGPDTDTTAQMGSKLVAAVGAWKTNIIAVDSVKRKLDKLIGYKA